MDHLYQSILSEASFGFAYHRVICDKDGTPVDYEFLEVNTAFEALTGLKADEIVGRTVCEVLPGIREGHFDWVAYYGDIALHGGKKQIEQYSLPLKKWYHVEAWAPESLHFVTIFTEVTEKRSKEESLTKREEHYHTILQSIGDAVITTDVDGRVVYMNPVAQQLTAWEHAKALGKPVNEVFYIVNAQTRKPVANPVHQVLEEGASRGLANHSLLIGNNGTEYHIADSAAPIKDTAGAITGVVLVFRDVSESYKMQEQIRESEMFLQETFDAIQDGLTVLDTALNIVRVNKHTSTRFSEHIPLKGKKCYQVFLGKSAPCAECPVLKSLESGKRHVQEVKVPLEKGGHKWEELAAYPVKGQAGNVKWVIQQVRDIDRRKKAEEEKAEIFREYEHTVKNLIEQIFRYKKNAEGNYVATFSEGKTAEKWNIATPVVKGKTLRELFDSSVLEQLTPYFNRAFAGETVTYDILLGEHWFMNSLHPFKWDENQQVQEIIGYAVEITQRKNAEQELMANEAKFRTLFEKSTDAIFIVDRKTGRYLNANKAAEKLTGYSLAQLQQKTNREITPEGAKERLELLKDTSEPVDFGEVTYLLPGGSRRTALLSSVPINHELIYGIATDITKRRQAEEALRQSEERYRQLFSNALVGILVHSPEGLIEAANAQAEHLLGISEKAMKEEPLEFWQDKLFRQDGRPMALSEFPFLRAVKTKKPVEAHIIGFSMSAQEDLRWFMTSTRPVLNEEGIPEMVIASFMEMTGQKRAEQALKDSEEKFRSIFQNSLTAMMVADDRGNYLEANEAATALTGYAKKELYKMNVADLKTVHPLDAGKKYQEYQKKGAEIGEIALHDKQGRLKIAQYHAIRIKKDFNVSVLADITARKNNEKALEEAKARAEESDRLKTAFLANMSHEIRTPMNSILGFTELLKKTNLSEAKQRKFIETISKSGKRMLNTINDLIDISRIEAGQIEVTWSEVHINALMQEMKTLFEPEAAQKGLQLQYIKALPAGKEVVSTDKEKLYHILKNLVNNGIKYTNAGYVTFGVDDQYQQLRFYVEDTGIGIAKDKQQVIFERFVQEDINLSRPYEGAGLGLSIIKAYVDMLGGKIWVESEKQQGSCFYFTLPRQ